MPRIVLAVFLICAAANVQLPEFGRFASEAGIGSGTMALWLQGYSAALFLGLLLLGGISEVLGRRTVLVAGMALAVLATASVAMWPTAQVLAVMRWPQGLAVALAMGAGTAWLAQRSTAATAARWIGLASTAGFAGGPLATTALLAMFPGQSRAIYAVQTVVFVLSALSLLPLADAPGVRRGVRLIRPPTWPKGSLLPGLGIALGWSVAGVVVAVLPGLFSDAGQAWAAGIAVTTMLAGGVLAQSHARRLSGLRNLIVGVVWLCLGAAGLAGAFLMQDAVAALVATALCGVATHGYLYVGGLVRLARVAPGDPRATSGFFVMAYLGFGVPAVGVGTIAEQSSPVVALSILTLAVVVGSLVVVALALREQPVPATDACPDGPSV